MNNSRIERIRNALSMPIAVATVLAVAAIPALGGGGDDSSALAENRQWSFSDVASSPFADDVEAIVAAGITSGYGDGRFGPNDGVTRGQMATFLVRALDVGSAGSAGFTDVGGHWAEDAINRLAAAGITSGYGDGRFGPNDGVTRGQMAALLVRAFELPAAAGTLTAEGARQPTIRSECGTCVLGERIAFTGEGYDPGMRRVMLDMAGTGAFADISADGRIEFTWSDFSGAGEHAINVYVSDNRNSPEPVASTTITLVQQSVGQETEAATPAVPETTTTVPSSSGVEPTTSTSAPAVSSTTEPTPTSVPVTTSTAPNASATTSPATTPRVLVFDETTMITNETLTLRPGDRIELRNGARLMFGEGATLDAQGSDTWSWTWDGSDPASISYNPSRDVRIFGEGHLMWMSGSLPATIRNVEVDVQPDSVLGHYPLHWHRVGDDARGTIVENVIVKNSTNRAFVPHGSHGITFRDVVAINTVDSAFWWDPPGTSDCSSAWRRFCTADNSDDTDVSRLLVSGVVPPGDSQGFRLSGVELGAGSGNSITDSVVVGVEPSAVKDCAAFQWPEAANRNEGGNTWRFLRNHGESRCHGIFVWQNDSNGHVVDGFTGGGIDHGAYSNAYLYRNVDVPYIEVHAQGWRVEDSSIGTVLGRKHQSSGRVDFVRVQIGSVVIDDAGGEAIDYVFTDSDVACADVVWISTDGSRVIIDDAECP